MASFGVVQAMESASHCSVNKAARFSRIGVLVNQAELTPHILTPNPMGQPANEMTSVFHLQWSKARVAMLAARDCRP